MIELGCFSNWESLEVGDLGQVATCPPIGGPVFGRMFVTPFLVEILNFIGHRYSTTTDVILYNDVYQIDYFLRSKKLCYGNR